MAAKRATVGDVLAKFLSDFRTSRRIGQFAVLDKRLVIQRPPDMSASDFRELASETERQHRAKMWQLLLDRFGIKSRRVIGLGEAVKLIEGLLADYVPAFAKAQVVPAKRAPGRPAKFTARQKATIAQAVADGKSVRATCLRLAKQDEQAGKALEAAYRRATKLVRRK